MGEPDGFREFVVARSPSLLRTAWMLTGDASTAEDLLQTALAKTWPHWTRVIREGDPTAYVTRAMANTSITWFRRKWHHEKPASHLPDRPGVADAFSEIDEREMIRRALMLLPPRQRS